MSVLYIMNVAVAGGGTGSVYARFDLRVSDGVIESVRPAGSSGLRDASNGNGGRMIDASGLIAVPGMVDTHIHLWESLFRGRMSDSWGDDYYARVPPMADVLSPEDVYVGTYAGCLELLSSGVTTVMDYCHCRISEAHGRAALEAVRDSGIRAVVGHDLHARHETYLDARRTHEGRLDDLFATVESVSDGDGGLVRFAACLTEFEPDDLSVVEGEIRAARERGLLIAFHNNFRGEITALDEAGLLGPDVLAIHSNYNSDDELRRMAATGTSLSTQPQTEVISGRRPMTMVSRARELGVNVALGTDVPCVSSLGMFSEMRVMYLLQRYIDGGVERSEGRPPRVRRPGVPSLSPSDCVEMATRNGAGALGLADVVGSLREGMRADLVLVDHSRLGPAENGPDAHLVMDSHAGDVVMVMVDGVVRCDRIGSDAGDGGVSEALSRRLEVVDRLSHEHPEMFPDV